MIYVKFMSAISMIAALFFAPLVFAAVNVAITNSAVQEKENSGQVSQFGYALCPGNAVIAVALLKDNSMLALQAGIVIPSGCSYSATEPGGGKVLGASTMGESIRSQLLAQLASMASVLESLLIRAIRLGR